MSRYSDLNFIGGVPSGITYGSIGGGSVTAMDCFQYAFFFHRVRTMTFSGTLLGVPFSFTTTSYGDELSQHQIGAGFQGSFPLRPTGGTITQLIATVTNNNLSVIPASSEPEVKYWTSTGVTVLDLSTGDGMQTFAEPTMGWTPTAVFTASLTGEDLVLGKNYNIPFSMYYGGPNSPTDSFPGNCSIVPASFWSFDGLYDTTTGARL